MAQSNTRIDPASVKWDIDPASIRWDDAKDEPINADPTGSFTENLAAGAGKAVADAGRGISRTALNMRPVQLPMLEVLRHILPKSFAEPANQARKANQDEIIESRRLDAPLMKTGGGQVGNLAGNLALVAPTTVLSGPSVLGGAMAGAGAGIAQPAVSDSEQLLNAGLGAAGGAGGQAVANKIGARVANRQALGESQKMLAARSANAAGYVIPPEDIGGGVTTRLLSGLSGKVKTAQEASAKNQPVTNALAKKALGIAEDTPMSAETLDVIRSQAGKAYEVVASAGTVTPGPKYTQALDDAMAPFLKAASGFPNAKPHPVIADIEALKSSSFDAGSAVEQIKMLREAADKAFRSGDKAAGKALKSASGALEQTLDDHLVSIGAPADTIKNFRQARQLIAKTYTVQKAMNPETGDVSAQVLARELAKGRPLGGELKTAAQVGTAFPKATQALKESPKSLSPLDFAAAGLGLAGSGGNPFAAAGLLARPVTRAALLSGPYQRSLLNTGPTAVERLLESGSLPAGVLGGVGLTPYLSK